MTGKKYLLLDADNTIYDFTATEEVSLRRIFDTYSISPDKVDVYHKGNKECWVRYENGTLDLETLETERFRMFFEAIGIDEDYVEAGKLYTDFLGEAGILLPGAYAFLSALDGRYDLSIITNGIARVQYERIKRTDTEHFFSNIFVSQEIGYAKPDLRFFNCVLEALGARKDECLIIGDSLTSDIEGAYRAGIDSIYLSFAGNKSEKAAFSAASYDEILTLLGVPIPQQQ